MNKPLLLLPPWYVSTRTMAAKKYNPRVIGLGFLLTADSQEKDGALAEETCKNEKSGAINHAPLAPWYVSTRTMAAKKYKNTTRE